jgi:cytochrome c553
MKRTTTAFIVVLMSTLSAPLFAEGKQADGSTLFEHHGCVNCHGAEAKNPVSKVVPTLAGKPADELFDKAKKILGGEGATKESQIMHAAFYSPSQCDAPPTDAELKQITAWLATL